VKEFNEFRRIEAGALVFKYIIAKIISALVLRRVSTTLAFPLRNRLNSKELPGDSNLRLLGTMPRRLTPSLRAMPLPMRRAAGDLVRCSKRDVSGDLCVAASLLSLSSIAVFGRRSPTVS
jgi:hypothetical protein